MMVRYGSEAFRKSLEETAAAVREGAHRCIVFVGGTAEAALSALSALSEYTSLSINQRNAESMVGERPLQTQGNLREAFDNATKDAAILFLDNADVLFADSERLAADDELDEDAHKPIDYLFQRISHREGVTVLHLNDSTYVEEARSRADAVLQL